MDNNTKVTKEKFEDELCEVYKIRVTNGEFINYSYVIKDKETSKGVIIDPSWQYDIINGVIIKEKIELDEILLTHSHNDHVNLVENFVKNYNCNVYVSELENYNPKFVSVSLLKDNEILKVGNLDIKAISTPGHTSGSMCYLLNKYLFTGDTIFIEGVGICSTNEEAEALYNSVQLIKNTIDKDVLVFPGHCYLTALGIPLSSVSSKNIYFSFKNKEQFIKFRMRKGQTSLLKFV